jgi:hypothetical protein
MSRTDVAQLAAAARWEGKRKAKPAGQKKKARSR